MESDKPHETASASLHESWTPETEVDPHSIPQAEGEPLIGDIVDSIRTVYDPEIPVNIYDLGLIYAIDSKPDGTVRIEMTLTTPGCPVAEDIPVWIRDAVSGVDRAKDVHVDIVWDPPWDPSMMSDYARIELGFY